MEYKENGSRYNNYYKWESPLYTPYDYKRNGLLKHIISNKIVSTDNEILKRVLAYYERSIIFVLKYIDHLKHFKNYHWKNR